MKRATITLACVAILGVIGGALAFKTSRQPDNVYTLLPGSKVITIIRAPGVICTTTVPNCTLTHLATTNAGPPVSVRSTTTNASVVTVFKCPTPPDVVTTYAYCTLWLTSVTPCNE
jgi:hypothetical protein